MSCTLGSFVQWLMLTPSIEKKKTPLNNTNMGEMAMRRFEKINNLCFAHKWFSFLSSTLFATYHPVRSCRSGATQELCAHM
jgi:hypothetical protein